MEFAEYKIQLIRLNSISDDVWKAFNNFDLNGDGYITGYELQRALKRIEGTHYSMEEVRAFIAEADLNYDGKVNLIGINMWWGFGPRWNSVTSLGPSFFSVKKGIKKLRLWDKIWPLVLSI